MIEKILNEKKDTVKNDVKTVNDAVLKIVNDDEVQKHFISGCLEFLHFFEAVLEAAPLSKNAREVVDNIKETKDNVIKNTVSVEAKNKIERIKIDNVKKATPTKKKGTPKE